ncbi:pilus assembly protein PilE [Acinetobacter sp. ANC 4470]|uniref:type IV pilin protein n=1 Tax=Acinetobacter sp. ANC 4470 TaxID=1977881 RepID=UPI000A3329DE|nr:type IV pilin protein [Acinetobacter sp. ANC 4470]OTG63919.1 pilus assembly protein PilE [Acinetobacter sp. ANC 4470]
MVKNLKGFTLIELMIVVAIIGIIAMFAYPAYQESVRKTKRIDAQASIIQIAGQLQRYKIANFTFFRVGTSTPIILADVGVPSVLPTSASPLYDLALTNVTAGTWTLVATPKLSTTQFGDGHIVLNHRGERCWTKGSDKGGSTCIPSATSNWDGR